MSLDIAFEATDGTPEIRDAVNEHFANLEQRFGPLHACRVVIKGRGADDDSDRYRVIIHLALAESIEVKVGSPPRPDARYKNLTFAISDSSSFELNRQRHLRRKFGSLYMAENRRSDLTCCQSANFAEPR